MHRRWIGALVGAAAFAAGGCQESEQALTASALVAQADVACKKATDQGSGALQAMGRAIKQRSATPAEAAAQMMAKSTRYRMQAVERLEALQPPDELRDVYDRYTAALRAFVTTLPTDQQQVADRDPDAGERRAAGRKAAALAQDLGFKVCR